MRQIYTKMVQTKLLLVFLFFFLVNNCLLAQKDTTNVKTKVYIFNSSSSTTSEDKYSYAVKFDPYQFAVGDLPISFESKFHEKMSFEVGAGPTLDYLGSVFGLLGSFTKTQNVSTAAEFGYLLKGHLRFYPSKDWDPIEGIYFAADLNTKRYNYSIDYAPQPFVVKNTLSSFFLGFTFGRQTFWDSSIASDAYITVGFRRKTESSSELIEDPPYSGNFHLSQQSGKPRWVPAISIGWKYGFGF